MQLYQICFGNSEDILAYQVCTYIWLKTSAKLLKYDILLRSPNDVMRWVTCDKYGDESHVPSILLGLTFQVWWSVTKYGYESHDSSMMVAIHVRGGRVSLVSDVMGSDSGHICQVWWRRIMCQVSWVRITYIRCCWRESHVTMCNSGRQQLPGVLLEGYICKM